MDDEGSKGKHERTNTTGVFLAVTLALDGGVARWGRGAAEKGVEDDTRIGECRGRDRPQRGYRACVGSV